MPHEGIQKQAFWLFGVIVGLAIKEALTKVFPGIIKGGFSEAWPEAVRLLVFLCLVTRFYLGASMYFDRVYGPASTIKKRSYVLDFSVTFVSFLIFFASALTISPRDAPPMLFPYIILGIMFYDTLWYRFSRRYETRQFIRLWMWINITTAILASLAFLICHVLGAPQKCKEFAAAAIVIFFSGLDMVEILGGRQIFKEKIANVIESAVPLHSPNRPES